MRSLSTAELLDAWEAGQGLSPAHRAYLLTAACADEQERPSVGELSIGERDGRLLRLRGALFGPKLTAVVSCPQCGERLDLEFATSDVATSDVAMPPPPPAGPGEIVSADLAVRYRPITSADLVAAAGQGPGQARRLLLERCLEARRGDEPVAAADLPESLIAEAIAGMARADPGATTELDLACPACATAWQAVFDIAAYLWAEVDAWAARILAEVHVLASAYGWPEHEILALTPFRRGRYLEMVGA